MEPDEIRQLLQRSLTDPAPATPSASITTAIARGRRRQARRRQASLAATTLLSLAIVIGGWSVVTRTPPAGLNHDAEPAASPPTSTPPVVPPPAFDPLLAHARPGWLPPGLVPIGDQSTAAHFNADYGYPVAPSAADDGAGVSVTLSQSGDTIALPRALHETAAPPVQGHPATWVQLDPAYAAADAALRWSYAPGAVAQVAVTKLRGGLDPQQVASRTADALEIGTFDPIALPMTVARIPPGAVVSSLWSAAQRGAGTEWDGGLVLTSHGSLIEILIDGEEPCPCIAYASHNTTVNGSPAWLIPNKSIIVYYGEYATGEIEVSLPGHGDAESERAAPAALAPLGLQGLAEAITVFPDPADWRPPIAR
jgi:hypothetical protein